MSGQLPRLPFVLLGAMTLFTFGGPILIGWALSGGPSPTWPPDRPVEWATLIGVSGSVFGLMVACLSLAAINRRAIARPTAARSPEPPGAGK